MINPKDLMELPKDLPVPLDDGACNHLQGMTLPSISLMTTQDRILDFSQIKKPTVIFAYPRTGEADKPTPEGWDLIPGARGCTPQSCGFRDLYKEFQDLGFDVFGLSLQSTEYQKEFVNRMHIPFEIISDEDMKLTRLLKLPTFAFNNLELLKRLALVIENQKITKVFYPVFPPNENGAKVLNWLKSRSNSSEIIEKAVAYITRKNGNIHEILVFDHDQKFSEAGTQVPAGTVDKLEQPEHTILRECLEESGLSDLVITAKIDEYVFYRDSHQQYNRRHVYHIKSLTVLPDKWTHTVHIDGEDDGHNFQYFWIKVTDAKNLLSGQLAYSIEKLEKYLI